MPAPTPDAPRAGRPRRSPPRPVEVVAVEPLNPRLVAVHFGGEALRGFPQPAPTAHIKVVLPDADGRLPLPVEGPDGLIWPEGRPTMRTYTPRRYDEASNTLEVWFVLHGEGPASAWAAQARPGDSVGIAGPGGRFALDESVGRWWIGGDESALPAVAMLIEALPETARAEVHLEVDDQADEIGLPAHPGVMPTWHHRRAGATLGDVLTGAELDPQVHVWLGCEASAVRRMRAHLLRDRALPAGQVTTRGYWRRGEADHPDHDYGED